MWAKLCETYEIPIDVIVFLWFLGLSVYGYLHIFRILFGKREIIIFEDSLTAPKGLLWLRNVTIDFHDIEKIEDVAFMNRFLKGITIVHKHGSLVLRERFADVEYIKLDVLEQIEKKGIVLSS